MANLWIVQSLQALISDLGDGSDIFYTHEVADGYKWRIEMIYRDLLAQELVNSLQDSENEALEYLAEAYNAISHFIEALPPSEGHLVSTAQQVLDGTVGRPYFEIPLSQLKYLIDKQVFCPSDS